MSDREPSKMQCGSVHLLQSLLRWRADFTWRSCSLGFLKCALWSTSFFFGFAVWWSPLTSIRSCEWWLLLRNLLIPFLWSNVEARIGIWELETVFQTRIVFVRMLLTSDGSQWWRGGVVEGDIKRQRSRVFERSSTGIDPRWACSGFLLSDASVRLRLGEKWVVIRVEIAGSWGEPLSSYKSFFLSTDKRA